MILILKIIGIVIAVISIGAILLIGYTLKKMIDAYNKECRNHWPKSFEEEVKDAKNTNFDEMYLCKFPTNDFLVDETERSSE